MVRCGSCLRSLLPILLVAVPSVGHGQFATGFDATGVTTVRVGGRPVDDVTHAVRLASGAMVLAGTFGTGLGARAFVARLLSDGSPDPAFGSGGVATLPAPSSGRAAVAHPDGGILLAATTGPSDTMAVAVARFTESGALDATYGTGGVATTDVPDLVSVGGIAVSAAGLAHVCGAAGDPVRGMVVRFDAGGAIDPSYGSGGISLAGPDTYASQIALTNTGVAYLAGINGVYAATRDLAAFCVTAAGDPCPGFAGGTGMATSTLGGASRSIGAAIVIDGAGRPVVAGHRESPNQAAVARFTTGGAADATFAGGLGYRLLGFPDEALASSIAIDALNRLVVAGTQAADFSADTPRLAMAARLTAAGALDATFGTAGRFTANVISYDSMVGLGIDDNGTIVLGGNTGPNLSVRSAATLAITPDGDLDTSYGASGSVVVPLSSATYSPVFGMALQADGRILIVGEAIFPDGSRPYVARLNPDGTLDPSFGGAGVATLPSVLGRDANEVAVAADGSIVATIARPVSTVSEALVHLDAAGSVDTAYGAAGLAAIPQMPNPIFSAILPLADGGVLATGVENATAVPIAVAKFTPQGGLDPAFGPAPGGVATVLVAGPDFARDARVLPDGRILLAASFDSSPSTPGLVQLTPTGDPDPTFDGDGVASLAIMGAGTTLLSVDDVSILTGGFLSGAPGGIFLARFDRNGVPDAGYGSAGVVTDSTVAPLDGLAGMAADGAGCVVVGGTTGADSTTRQAALARFLPDGSPDPTFGTGGGITASIGYAALTTDFALDPAGNALLAGSVNSGVDVLGLVARFPAACNDGNACTTDQCTAGAGCAHTQLLGIAGARCLCDATPSECDGQTPPANVTRKAGKACEALALAEDSDGKKRKRRLGKARRLFQQAKRNALRAGRGKKPKLAAECAAALGANFTEQRSRALEAIQGA